MRVLTGVAALLAPLNGYMSYLDGSVIGAIGWLLLTVYFVRDWMENRDEPNRT